MSLMSVAEMSVIMMSVLSLTGFERRVPPVSTGSVGDIDVSFVTDSL